MAERFKNYSIGVVCLLVLFVSTQTYAAGPATGNIPENMIAALKDHHAVYPVDDEGRELRPRLPK